MTTNIYETQPWELSECELDDLEKGITENANAQIYEEHKDRYNRLKTFNKNVNDKICHITVTIKDVWNWNPNAS